MALLVIQLIITFVFTFFFYTCVLDKVEAIKKSGAITAAMVAAFAVLMSTGVDELLKFMAQPRFEISTNRKEGYVDIKIKMRDSALGYSGAMLSSISLEYPVKGVINGFQDVNPITKARSSAFVIGGERREDFSNHLDLEIKDIAPGTTLHYALWYRPAKAGSYDIGLIGLDRYEVRYTWQYKSEELTDNQWRLVENDDLTEPPSGRAVGAKVWVNERPPWVDERGEMIQGQRSPIPKRKLEPQ